MQEGKIVHLYFIKLRTCSWRNRFIRIIQHICNAHKVDSPRISPILLLICDRSTQKRMKHLCRRRAIPLTRISMVHGIQCHTRTIFDRLEAWVDRRCRRDMCPLLPHRQRTIDLFRKFLMCTHLGTFHIWVSVPSIGWHLMNLYRWINNGN